MPSPFMRSNKIEDKMSFKIPNTVNNAIESDSADISLRSDSPKHKQIGRKSLTMKLLNV